MLFSDLRDPYEDEININLEMPSKAKEDTFKFIPEFDLKRDNALTTLSTVEKVYFVSFDLWISEHSPGWKNVLHLTTGDSNKRYGNRIPLVNVRNSGKLHINSAVNGEKAYTYDHPPVLIAKTWINIEIQQKAENEKVEAYWLSAPFSPTFMFQFFFQIAIDNVVVHTVENKEPASFNDVTVYASNPWKNSVVGKMRNLLISTKKI